MLNVVKTIMVNHYCFTHIPVYHSPSPTSLRIPKGRRSSTALLVAPGGRRRARLARLATWSFLETACSCEMVRKPSENGTSHHEKLGKPWENEGLIWFDSHTHHLTMKKHWEIVFFTDVTPLNAIVGESGIIIQPSTVWIIIGEMGIVHQQW
jgi:hypothetical protein